MIQILDSVAVYARFKAFLDMHLFWIIIEHKL